MFRSATGALADMHVTALALTTRHTISKGQCVKTFAAQVFRNMPAVAHFSAVRFDEENNEVSYKMQVSWHSRSTIACMPHCTFSMQDGLLASAALHAGTYRCDNRSCMHSLQVGEADTHAKHMVCML